MACALCIAMVAIYPTTASNTTAIPYSTTLSPTTPSPTTSATHTLDLISYGFNMITAKLSGSLILDNDFLDSDIEAVSTSGGQCSYDSMKFNDDYSAFSSFAQQDSAKISTNYGNSDGGEATGSLSENRQQTRTAAKTAQYYIYTMKTECAKGRISVGAANQLHWNYNFINNFRILPRNYSNEEDLEDFTSFWSSFGTHIFKSIELGGIIEGTIVASKCTVASTFASEEDFQACLNAQYNGIDLESCQSSGTQSQEDSSISTAFESKRIVAKGGDLSSFASIVEQFDSEDKSGDFNDWINSLSLDNYNVVGGNTEGIWKVIEDAIDLKPHTLNDASSVALSDDEWRAIAMAMEDAYDDYAEQIAAEHNSVDDCNYASGSFECETGSLDEADCVCTSCSSALECCGLIAAASEEESWWKQYRLYICIPGSVVLLCCIVGWFESKNECLRRKLKGESKDPMSKATPPGHAVDKVDNE